MDENVELLFERMDWMRNGQMRGRAHLRCLRAKAREASLAGLRYLLGISQWKQAKEASAKRRGGD